MALKPSPKPLNATVYWRLYLLYAPAENPGCVLMRAFPQSEYARRGLVVMPTQGAFLPYTAWP